ncbi:hypothetical protein [Stieleria varia]|uniref:Uncharacterized protein n=1 Tax=Stieleria varia TaxID=2528005 RepID=A0A5C6AN40_9BACT|nr:hypothetical protein [Stieleria varia]TWU00821.1 hypothetical protein Pla52n_41900 [Stieleria varia]
MTHPKPSNDWFFRGIVALVCCVAFWLLLTPFVPAVARSTMGRFHLSSSSFAWFALQQPIPAMYNFSNQYEVQDVPADFLSPILDQSERRYINHFPMRVLTFANTRYLLTEPGTDRWVTLWTTYRGQTMETRVHLKPLGDGKFEMIREALP